MKTQSRHANRLLGLALATLIAGTGCGGDGVTATSPSAPSSAAVPQASPPPAGTVTAGTFVLADALTVAIQDEYHAEAIYQRVLLDFGSVNPFSNIVRAEQNHAAALAGLFRVRGLAVPGSAWNADNVPRFASVREACAAAYQAEIDNIAVYDRYFGEELPDDVRRVFTNNRAASLNNHMPAFDRCR